MSIFYKFLLRAPSNPEQVSDDWVDAVADLDYIPPAILTQLNADIMQRGFVSFSLASRITELLDAADVRVPLIPHRSNSDSSSPLSIGAAKLLLRGGLKDVLREIGPTEFFPCKKKEN
jgi:hypothetical protein